MRWGSFFSVTIIVIFIVLFQWSNIKQSPKKDKIAFFSLLFIGWMLSMFNLPDMRGPTAWIEVFFRPFGRFMEK